MQETLNSLNIDTFSLLIGLGAGLIIASLFFIGKLIRAEKERARLENMGQTFDTLAQESLKKSTEQFMQIAELRLKNAHDDGAHELEKKKEAISKLIEPVNKTLSNMDEKLKDLEKVRLSAYSELRTQMEGMNRDQATLRQETSSLVQALRSPSTRGQWGEMQLKRCLEMAGMVEGVHFSLQVSNEGMRPDAIINLPGDKQVIIDAKAPIDAYLNAFKDDVSEHDRNKALDAHAKHVKSHMKNLGAKSYWSQFESPEFVIMFLPGESYFSAALERDPGLIEAGVSEKVIPASPTTLISLCKAVMYGWSQEKLAESAREISELGTELYKRVSVFGRHMQDMGKGLERALSSYNKAVGSLESNVLPQARRFNEFHIGQSQDLPDLTSVESATRSLSAPELLNERVGGEDGHIEDDFDKSAASGLKRLNNAVLLIFKGISPILRPMDTYEIITAPASVLKETASPITRIDDSVRTQMDKMLQTMYEANGIGLAANQINILNRVLVMDLSARMNKDEGAPIFMINPEIIWSSDEPSILDEGCLSIPEQFAEVQRPKEVRVKYLDYDGNEQEDVFSDLASHCVQHEIDHLNGGLFIDYLSRLKRNMMIRKVQKIVKGQSVL